LATIVALMVLTVYTSAVAWSESQTLPGPWMALNAVGAWLVRWLQFAAPDAYEHFYLDATLGGLVIGLAVGAVVGALFAGVLERLPQDHPLAWGIVGGLGLWAVTWWRVLPALDPAAVTHLTGGAWLAMSLTYGLLIGLWVSGERHVRRNQDTPQAAWGSAN
jgi:hypothetical protein